MKIRITGKKLPKAQWGNTGLFQMGQSLQNAMKLKQNPLYDPNNPAVQNLTGSARFPTGSISRFGPMSLNLGPEQYALTQGSDGILDSSRGFVTEEDTNAFDAYDWTKAKQVPEYNNLMDVFNTGSKKQMRQSVKDYNKQFGTNVKGPGLFTMGAKGRETMNHLSNTFNKIGDGIKIGTVIGSAITNLADARKKEKEFNRWKRSQLNSDYLSMPVEGSRGDYVASGSRFGEFRPDDYVVNKGMYTGQFFPRMMQSGGVIPEALSFPITPMEANISTAPAVEPKASSSKESSSKSYRSSGANEEAEQTWSDISNEYKGVENWGIWGDARHKKTKSDHNSGDALDIGISSEDQGTQIAQKLIKEAQERNIKYIIWNKKIWNPSVSNDWRPYSGDSPHTDHVHVSFNRNPETLGQISLTHNNPLNIHHGDFSQKYGGKQGSKDGGGYVSMFPDLNTGIQAAKDLLFGPNYSNLTISQARNKWVKGDPGVTSESSSHIVKAIGADKRISELSAAEKEQLLKLFAKWEGKQAYNKIKEMKLFEEGGLVSYAQDGVYELTEDEIKSVLAAGGEVEFI